MFLSELRPFYTNGGRPSLKSATEASGAAVGETWRQEQRQRLKNKKWLRRVGGLFSGTEKTLTLTGCGLRAFGNFNFYNMYMAAPTTCMHDFDLHPTHNKGLTHTNSDV